MFLISLCGFVSVITAAPCCLWPFEENNKLFRSFHSYHTLTHSHVTVKICNQHVYIPFSRLLLVAQGQAFIMSHTHKQVQVTTV